MLRIEIEDSADGTCVADAVADNTYSPDNAVRILARNELLFETGDLKTKIYRVEAGALCVYRTHPDLRIEIIEHALAGDLVGMGFLERQTATARATVETKIRCLDLDAIEHVIENDDHNRVRYHDAVQREFAFRRDSLASSARERPIVRLAAFLVAVSHRIGEEGGDPALVDDTVDCGVIADFLGLSVDLLALALMQLEMRGLVETAPPHGLRLMDVPALEAIAEEQESVVWSMSSADLRASAQ